jgi:hypothetical protein
VSGGTDISFLSGLRIPCAILLGTFVVLMLVGIGSCVSCMIAEPEGESSGPAQSSLGGPSRSTSAQSAFPVSSQGHREQQGEGK